MDKKNIQYSANFKRDYVAASAIGIFIFIVVAELLLAFSLPMYMKKENVLALSVRRLRLIETFDHVRGVGQRLQLRSETANAELKLIMWNLDLLSDYLRKYSKFISSDEIVLLQNQLNEMNGTLTQLQTDKPFSQEYKLDCSGALENILNQSGVLNVR